MVVIVIHNCVWRGEGKRRGEEERGGGEGKRRGEEEREGGEGRRRRGEEERGGGEGKRKYKGGGGGGGGGKGGWRRRKRERAQHSSNQVFPHLLPLLTSCLSTDIHMGKGCTDCQEVKVFLVRESAYQEPTFCFLHCSKLLNGCDVALEEGGELLGQLTTKLSTHGSLLTLRVLKCLRSSGSR